MLMSPRRVSLPFSLCDVFRGAIERTCPKRKPDSATDFSSVRGFIHSAGWLGTTLRKPAPEHAPGTFSLSQKLLAFCDRKAGQMFRRMDMSKFRMFSDYPPRS